jgi:hypothetical protein
MLYYFVLPSPVYIMKSTKETARKVEKVLIRYIIYAGGAIIKNGYDSALRSP